MRRSLPIAVAALAAVSCAVPCAALAAGPSHARDPRAVTTERLARASAEIREYRASTGELPKSREGLDGVLRDPSDLVDGWGNPVVYIRVAGGFWVVSWGADGVPGGTGDAADLVDMGR